MFQTLYLIAFAAMIVTAVILFVQDFKRKSFTMTPNTLKSNTLRGMLKDNPTAERKAEIEAMLRYNLYMEKLCGGAKYYNPSEANI